MLNVNRNVVEKKKRQMIVIMMIILQDRSALSRFPSLPVYSDADVTEPNSSDSRGERLDFFLKQEEALAAESGFLGTNESEEAAGGGRGRGGGSGGGRGGGGIISSVANLKAALMSKNSLLSLRAEMMGDDNPLLYEYLPKGGHSLTCKSLFTDTNTHSRPIF